MRREMPRRNGTATAVWPTAVAEYREHRTPSPLYHTADARRQYADIRQALICGRPNCTCRRDGKVHCPAHDDTTPSLSLTLKGDQLLWHCHAGCTQDAVAEALRRRGLWPTTRGEGGGVSSRNRFEHSNTSKREGGSVSSRNRFEHSNTPKEGEGGVSSRNRFEHSNTPGLTLKQYAEAKKLPLECLAEWGVTDASYMGKPVVRIEYRDAAGEVTAVRFRTGPREFRWRRGDKPCLYGLWRPLGRTVVLCEGESDCHTLWLHGIDALGLPGAGNWREERDAAHLASAEVIYVVVEPDKGGEAVRRWLSNSSIRDRARLVTLGDAKDPSGLYLSNPDGFAEAWRDATARAVPWTEEVRRRTEDEERRLWRECQELATDPNLLARIESAIRAGGYAGDAKPALLAYLALTSRRLERPLNICFVAPSGAGKNRAVDAALALVPPEDVYLEKAGSARALIYADADFQRKVVVFQEADSIPEDGPAASAIRSLAADNSMGYDVVEKDARTGSFYTRHIEKPGPTGLITTSTRSLGEQLGTRMLEVSIPDCPQQTRAVLRAHALAVATGGRRGVDPAPFLALQRWLNLQGWSVVVPFAEALADLVPADAVRMRRDFRQLLTAIQAVALLHRAQRPQTERGEVLATLEDYRIARDLLTDVFDQVAADNVTPAVRETVNAVQEGEEVSEAELAERLGLAKASTHYRVRRALAGGWLVNTESRRGHPYRLTRGTPLPEARSALPSVEALREVFECSNPNREDTPPLPPEVDPFTDLDPFADDDGGEEQEGEPPAEEGGGDAGGTLPNDLADACYWQSLYNSEPPLEDGDSEASDAHQERPEGEPPPLRQDGNAATPPTSGNPSAPSPPTYPCPICGEAHWRFQVGTGRWVCPTCQPTAPDEELANLVLARIQPSVPRQDAGAATTESIDPFADLDPFADDDGGEEQEGEPPPAEVEGTPAEEEVEGEL